MNLYNRLYNMLSEESCLGNGDDPYPDIATALALFKRELEYSERDSIWLHYLEVAGVDNWSGIEYAQELYEAEAEII
jgi:hypothetical protein